MIFSKSSEEKSKLHIKISLLSLCTAVDYRNVVVSPPPSPTAHSKSVPVIVISEFATRVINHIWFPSTTTLTPPIPISTISPTTPTFKHLSQSSPFHRTPSFEASVKFISQIIVTTSASLQVIYVALYYIAQLKLVNSRAIPACGMERRCFLIALMLANKYLDDERYTNMTWAQICGFSLREINLMEMEFLNSIQYKLFISSSCYEHWVTIMERFAWQLDRYTTTSPYQNHISTFPIHEIAENKKSSKNKYSFKHDTPSTLSMTRPHPYHIPQRLAINQELGVPVSM